MLPSRQHAPLPGCRQALIGVQEPVYIQEAGEAHAACVAMTHAPVLVLQHAAAGGGCTLIVEQPTLVQVVEFSP